MKCEPWEIWWANVKFEDGEQSVTRPVLVIGVSGESVICLKMTKIRRSGEYVMLDWEKSGLPRETTVRQTKLLQLEFGDLKSKIGDVSVRDRANITRIIE